MLLKWMFCRWLSTLADNRYELPEATKTDGPGDQKDIGRQQTHTKNEIKEADGCTYISKLTDGLETMPCDMLPEA